MDGGVVGGPQQRLIQPAGDAQHGIQAVSYTHLRAHETVLDLVCRLLLEKKHELELNSDRSMTPQTH